MDRKPKAWPEGASVMLRFLTNLRREGRRAERKAWTATRRIGKGLKEGEWGK